ncbi:gamma-glutamyltransferase [Pseudomonas soli]|jgi:gamma-glutamyltranspeptidase/glutathione hydrolase|uniref:Glutathione hydrolase proenzyme n=1 Tax=Pseudomonas soli TaxID=1306993 RepID=A0A1H9IAJ7_9PSED|nr:MULTISPECIES: gamma-glutamyltransferase [Pseudomonas]AUY35251.1 gamma-glutamyltransferase [Pseudomonas sp. PONIH3]MDT3713379.1 gamma-glutamyltransferase [Pseudomonas soli]MDT3729560.1 gamma-glutamyltransferase [Pseudomonas soli]MEE1878842.1 gamma-glutamyltransferase [Pseudomonas soli]NBK37424.1 gamma-glutamyltransferase [Pseudomonas soli]
MPFVAALQRAALGACLALLACAAQAQGPGRAAIASPHSEATSAAQQILQQDGNAFDAAVAISATLAVVEPYGSGLGGGGFFLLRESGATPRYTFLDARERAPAAARADMYLKDGKVQPGLSINGPLAAAIPGLPQALADLASTHGKLPLKDSLAPAIRLANQGFAVDRIYRDRATMRLSALRDDAESARLFLSGNDVPALGTVIRQPELAATLQAMAEQGRDGFYRGPLARRLAEGVRQAGGIWTLDDLAGYRTAWREPLRYPLADQRELISSPPPSAGGVALAQSLAMLQRLPWQSAAPVQRSHYVIEVLRRAYRDRGLLGDPDYVSNPINRLLARQYLTGLADSIDVHQATPSSALPPSPAWREGDHTTHFAVIDGDGNAVSATLSVNLPFGAAFSVPGTGVVLNNEMDDFAADPGGSNSYGLAGSQANAVAAGKRPLSSMSPTFIESPSQLATFGTPGGSRIPSMVLLSVLGFLEGRPVAEWPASPRYHHQYLPDVVEHEPGTFSARQKAELEGRGYRLKDVGRQYGNQQVLYWNKAAGTLEAASDPRGVGQAAIVD